jgi:hypothetical protein
VPDGLDARPRIDRARPWVWGGGILAAIVLLAAVGIGVLRIYAIPDRSTPTATVTGYFAALQVQDYARAWQFTSASNEDQSSEAAFAQNQQAANNLSGRIISFHIVQLNEDGNGHATGVLTISRSGAPNDGATESVSLTQYGGNWLIDSVTGA